VFFLESDFKIINSNFNVIQKAISEITWSKSYPNNDSGKTELTLQRVHISDESFR